MTTLKSLKQITKIFLYTYKMYRYIWVKSTLSLQLTKIESILENIVDVRSSGCFI